MTAAAVEIDAFGFDWEKRRVIQPSYLELVPEVALHGAVEVALVDDALSDQARQLAVGRCLARSPLPNR